jgi:hypothetical protein
VARHETFETYDTDVAGNSVAPEVIGADFVADEAEPIASDSRRLLREYF